jgi:ubiquinone/menaquinone biosynthesis C-methylase UbiE
MANLDEVRSFWEANPLWSGESSFDAGTVEFYKEHREVYISDCFGGFIDPRFLPQGIETKTELKILDLGCGVGFWVTEFAFLGFKNLFAADLTTTALDLTKKRLELFGYSAELSQQNAEQMTFENNEFDYINCQGVIHHTPNTELAVQEIARVLKPGGTGSISVYYKNPILRLWPLLRWFGWILAKLGGGLKGRGRENIFLEKDVSEIVRLYDGDTNPLGKCYSKTQFVSLLSKHFDVEETYLHFFPARSIPIFVPKWIHRFLDAHLGFMIYATIAKPCAD